MPASATARALYRPSSSPTPSSLGPPRGRGAQKRRVVFFCRGGGREGGGGGRRGGRSPRLGSGPVSRVGSGGRTPMSRSCRGCRGWGGG